MEDENNKIEQKLVEYQNNLNNYLKFLLGYKSKMGLDKYDIRLANTISPDNLDEIEIDAVDKNINLTLSQDFLFMGNSQKINHLIKMLVEARVQLFHEETLDVTERYRNELIQDITRGLVNVHVLQLEQRDGK